MIDRSQLVSIQHAITHRADELLRGDDLITKWDAHEWVTAFVKALGDVATVLQYNRAETLDESCVLELGALVQVWLEREARERAA